MYIIFGFSPFPIFFLNLKAQVITIAELLFIVVYTPSMITQLLVPCYFGSDLAAHGDQLLLDMAASNWIFATLHYKKLYRIAMSQIRATTFETTVGFVIPLNLQTFLTVSVYHSMMVVMIVILCSL